MTARTYFVVNQAKRSNNDLPNGQVYCTKREAQRAAKRLLKQTKMPVQLMDMGKYGYWTEIQILRLCIHCEKPFDPRTVSQNGEDQGHEHCSMQCAFGV